MNESRPSTNGPTARHHDDKARQNKARERSHGVCRVNEPECHQDDAAMNKNRALPSIAASLTEFFNHTPGGRQPENKTNHPELILGGRDSGPTETAVPRIVGSAQIGIVTNQQNGEWDHHKPHSSQKALDGREPVSISQNHEHHDQVGYGFDPA